LDLSSSRIKSVTINALADVLEKNGNAIKELLLNHNAMSNDSLAAIARILSGNNNVESIELSDIYLVEEEMRVLETALGSKNTRLTLDPKRLRENPVFSRKLHKNAKLHERGILSDVNTTASGHSVDLNDVAEIITAACNSSRFHLLMISIQPETREALAGLAQNTSITTIIFEKIDQASVEELAKILQNNSTVKWIFFLDGYDATNPHIEKIQKILANNNQSLAVAHSARAILPESLSPNAGNFPESLTNIIAEYTLHAEDLPKYKKAYTPGEKVYTPGGPQSTQRINDPDDSKSSPPKSPRGKV